MRKLIYFLIFFNFSSASFLFASEDRSMNYGSQGSFELASGFTGVLSNNTYGIHGFSIGVLPYANHFIFSNFFLRYDLGFGYVYNNSSGIKTDFWTFNPGIGAGYSIRLSDNWRLNLALGYLLFLTNTSNNQGNTYNNTINTVAFYPEIKYLISHKWAVSIFTRAVLNLPNVIAGTDQYLSATTATYFAISYIFQ